MQMNAHRTIINAHRTIIILIAALLAAAGASAAYYYPCPGVFNTACTVNGVMYRPPGTIIGHFTSRAYATTSYVDPMPEYPGFVTREAYIPEYVPTWRGGHLFPSFGTYAAASYRTPSYPYQASGGQGFGSVIGSWISGTRIPYGPTGPYFPSAPYATAYRGAPIGYSDGGGFGLGSLSNINIPDGPVGPYFRSGPY